MNEYCLWFILRFHIEIKNNSIHVIRGTKYSKNRKYIEVIKANHEN